MFFNLALLLKLLLAFQEWTCCRPLKTEHVMPILLWVCCGIIMSTWLVWFEPDPGSCYCVLGQCVIPENIHTSPKDFFVFSSDPPRWNFQFCFILALKNFGFWDPPPLGVSNDHPWSGYGYFVEPHNIHPGVKMDTDVDVKKLLVVIDYMTKYPLITLY